MSLNKLYTLEFVHIFYRTQFTTIVSLNKYYITELYYHNIITSGVIVGVIGGICPPSKHFLEGKVIILSLGILILQTIIVQNITIWKKIQTKSKYLHINILD